MHVGTRDTCVCILLARSRDLLRLSPTCLGRLETCPEACFAGERHIVGVTPLSWAAGVTVG